MTEQEPTTESEHVATFDVALMDLIENGEEWLWDLASEEAGFRISEPEYRVYKTPVNSHRDGKTLSIAVYGYEED